MKKKDPLQKLVKSLDTPLSGEEKDNVIFSLDIQDWCEENVILGYMERAGMKNGQRAYRLTAKGKLFIENLKKEGLLPKK